MKAYISVDYNSRKKLSKEFIAMGMALSAANVEQFIFVDKYHYEDEQESDVFQKALIEIDNSNFMIVEATYIDEIVCIEAGYAKAKRKPIVYLQHKDAPTNPVLSGICNFHIFYDSPKELFDQMSEFLKNVLLQH